MTYNANGTVTITVSSTAGTPTGTATLAVNGGIPFSATLASNGTATFNLPSPDAGDYSLQATFAAQGNYLGSTASGMLHVNPAATTVTINTSTVTYSDDGSANVTVTSAAGSPIGDVTLSVDGGAPKRRPSQVGRRSSSSPARAPGHMHCTLPTGPRATSRPAPLTPP